MSYSGKSLIPALFLVLCLIALPSLASASSIEDITNVGGTLSGSAAGLTLSGSTVISIDGSTGDFTGNLGTLSFATLGLTSGSLQTGGTFGDGGSFTISSNGNGANGGTLFTGSFSGPVTWTLITLANGTHNYTLTGTIIGTMNGVKVDGATVQLTINTGKGYFNGSTTLASGDTNFTNAVPEPSTLAFFGTGIVGLAGLLRRKSLTR
jgi:hypothetical protein